MTPESFIQGLLQRLFAIWVAIALSPKFLLLSLRVDKDQRMYNHPKNALFGFAEISCFFSEVRYTLVNCHTMEEF
jgi:hypothetical protein